jgi:hypothetical protein
MTIRDVITAIVIALLITLFVLGSLSVWYVFDETALCQKYERANPDINFKLDLLSTGCMFELFDETWVNLRDYKEFNQYKLRIK